MQQNLHGLSQLDNTNHVIELLGFTMLSHATLL